jgi:hypothetical protein
VEENLALVVGGAAGIDAAASFLRFEGGRGPKVQRFCRLNVIVPVNEEGRSMGPRAAPFTERERLTSCFQDRSIEAGPPKVFGDPLSRSARVRGVL